MNNEFTAAPILLFILLWIGFPALLAILSHLLRDNKNNSDEDKQ